MCTLMGAEGAMADVCFVSLCLDTRMIIKCSLSSRSVR